MSKEIRIVIGFYGITRSLSFTIDSINECLVGAASRFGDVKVVAHLFDQSTVVNPRSGESGSCDPNEYSLLNAERVELEPPFECLKRWDFEAVAARGDCYRDQNNSLRNLVSQLHSLHRVHSIIESLSPDLVIFARPDLRYLDDFGPYIERALQEKGDFIMVPDWQWWGGVNDRFSICTPRAAEVFGKRIEKITKFMDEMNRPLHAERLLRFVIRNEKLRLLKMPVRAVRVRIGGAEKKEDFSSFSSGLPWQLLEGIKEQIVKLGLWHVKGDLRRRK